MKRLIAAIVFAAFPVSVLATVYQWVDNQGVINFTDSPDKIPPKYRARAKQKDLSEEKNIMVIGGENKTSPPSAASGEDIYGGHPAAWWRSRLTGITAQIDGMTAQLAAKRQRLSELHHKRVVYQKGSDRVDYNDLKKEIDDDEARLAELQEKLNSLQAEAAAAGVPPVKLR